MTFRLTSTLVAILLVAGCASSGGASSATGSARTTRSKSTTTTSAAATPTTTAITATTTPITSGSSNHWVGSVNPRALPLGDNRVSTSAAAVGGLYACNAGNPGGGGAFRDGPWIQGSTWDSTAKIAVQGAHTWPAASYATHTTATERTFTTNDLPTRQVTGTFPVAASDPAFQYDRNPNSIVTQSINLSVPLHPAAASSPGCLPGGPIGILANGVVLFDALDALNRDAVAHEIQDVCQGHPNQGEEYHYHSVPSCLLSAATGSGSVVGWASDGYPIVVERDTGGNLPTDADLDVCHGRTSPVTVDGQAVTTYHYDATLEFPYTVGCFHGTAAGRGAGPGGAG